MWLIVKGPGSWGTHGRIFQPGRYWVVDEGILEAAERWPGVVTLEDGPAPAAGEPDHEVVVETHLVGPLSKADLKLGEPDAEPDEDEAVGPGEPVPETAGTRKPRRR